MADTDFFLPAQYVNQIADQVTRMGARLPEWFTRLQRPGASGEMEIQHLSLEDFLQLLREAIHRTGEPAFGLLLGERLRVTSHGILGYAAAQSVTLRQAMEVITRYMLVRTSLLTVQLDVQGPHARLVFAQAHALGDVRDAVLEAVVLTVKNLLDYITVGAAQVTSVAFPFPAPAHAELARQLFKCEVHHDADWLGLTLPAVQLDRPLHTGHPQAWIDAVQHCQAELARLQRQQSLSARVRRLMLEKQGGFPSLAVTARLLNMTPRTLHRHLNDEGTSYRAILEDIRHRLAVEHVKAGRLSMQEIAFLLGYDDLANFRRAFKRWEGMAPTLYRASGAAPP